MLLPKLYVEGSIPFARSNFLSKGRGFLAHGGLTFGAGCRQAGRQ